MRTKVIVAFAALVAGIPVAAWNLGARRETTPATVSARPPHGPAAAKNPVEARQRADFAAMRTFRPGYVFWRHVFTIPDGRIAFGSAVDGRLLATFPVK